MITAAALVTLMVNVPGGSYLPFFSSDKKPVALDAFQIDVFPVTNEQFLAFVRANPEWRRSKIKTVFADSHYLESWSDDLELSSRRSRKSPVTQTSWFAASAYCKSLGKELPSVDQWEYAASEGGKIKASTTSKILEWYSRPTPEVLPPVGSAPKNEFGIAGLHGLVWEWTRDFNSQVDAGGDESFCGNGGKGARDPSDYAAFMRFSFRNSLKASYTTANLGFRCVKEVRP